MPELSYDPVGYRVLLDWRRKGYSIGNGAGPYLTASEALRELTNRVAHWKPGQLYAAGLITPDGHCLFALHHGDSPERELNERYLAVNGGRR